ncbi:hypothetical protein DDR33_03280 [Pararcticibacter amylolyticus]|uniref:Uncharacterized protein n=1 Tax=Pararcticibacter amylolyticus TaxID=2173175 RepID=A0A2U2PKW8_9SPHI|nr:hypothetical protein DDR33_03280 [Pararcticibacter amylolyticus]
MKVLLTGIVSILLSLLVFTFGNFIIQLFSNWLFITFPHALAAISSILICGLLIYKTVAYMLIFPYSFRRMETMIFFYCWLILLVLAFISNCYREDFYLDNSIPKWVQIVFSFLYIFFWYGQKINVKAVANVNREMSRNYEEEYMSVPKKSSISQRSKYIIMGILLVLILTNPSRSSFTSYLHKSHYDGVGREFNGLVFSVYSYKDIRYLGILGNFIRMPTSPF